MAHARSMDLSGVTRDVVVPVGVGPPGGSGPTPKQARGPRWRRTSCGRYVPSHVDATFPDQRIVEAAAALPDGGAVTGWAALHWRGSRWFGGVEGDGATLRPVPLWVGDNRRIRTPPGCVISEEWVRPDEVTVVDGLPVTTPLRSLAHETRRAHGLWTVVRHLDMAAADDLVSLAEWAAYLDERLGGTPRVRRSRLALTLADENAWSPPEVSMRRAWTEDGGHPQPLCNVPVFDESGRHLFTPDLLDPEHGVAGEYDGRGHLQLEQRTSDVRREALLRDHGIEPVTMLATDLKAPTAFVARLHAAYRRARSGSPARRSWTLDRPVWWVDTTTVAARRRLTGTERDVWLRYRSA